MGLGTFPFGAPVTARPPSASSPRQLLVLGAYPSALHASWRPPAGSGLKPVRAVPVADEPSPFWDGRDAQQRVADWVAAFGIVASRHGSFATPERLNGPSGAWVTGELLEPLDGRTIRWTPLAHPAAPTVYQQAHAAWRTGGTP